MHKYLAKLWKKPNEGMPGRQKERMVRWRGEAVVSRVEKPTRPDRARSLGYKAKQGIIVARVKVKKGGRKRPKTAGGRKPSKSGRFFTLDKSRQQVAEEKAARKYVNCEVLNSYWVGEDGKSAWYEVILADTTHPSIRKDRTLKWAASKKHSGRTQRGLTSSGKKSRGMRHKGKKT